MTKKPKTAKTEEPEEKKKETTMEFVASMAVVLVTGLFIITFNLQAFEIPSSSMENTLLIGDHVFVDRITLAPKTPWVGPLVPYRGVRHGDIVVFLSPAESGLYVVKRVIGLPGDRIHLVDGAVYRNGERLSEPYKNEACDDISVFCYSPYRDNFPAVPTTSGGGVTPEWGGEIAYHLDGGDLVVPPGRYFVMGDNRKASYDSRYWGFVPREHVIGRPMFIYWSFETPRDQYKKTSVAERAQFLLKVILHFFDQTRWRRSFQMVS